MNVTIHHAELSTIGGQQVYVLTAEVDRPPTGEPDAIEGGLEVHIMPTDVFETRAAEYAINPDTKTGWDDVLHIVFYEQMLPESAESQLADPDHLMNAATVVDARKAKLAKIKAHRGKGKLRGVAGHSEARGLLDEAIGLQNSAAEDPLEFIKRTAPMSESHMRVKAEFTRRRRNHVRARRAGRDVRGTVPEDVAEATRRARADMLERESADELAARLLGTPEDQNQPPSST